jgi:hypothetical protein
MYYLTFLWPEVRTLLERNDFTVSALERRCPKPYEHVLIVIATKVIRQSQ